MAENTTKTPLIASRVIISVSNYLETQKNLLQHAETAILDFGQSGVDFHFSIN